MNNIENIIEINNKRINVLKKQIEKAKQRKNEEITIEEIYEIKRGLKKLTMYLFFVPTIIITFLCCFISVGMLTQSIIFSISYLILIIPMEKISQIVFNNLYKKDIKLIKELDNYIANKSNEINNLYNYNKQLENKINIENNIKSYEKETETKNNIYQKEKRMIKKINKRI